MGKKVKKNLFHQSPYPCIAISKSILSGGVVEMNIVGEENDIYLT